MSARRWALAAAMVVALAPAPAPSYLVSPADSLATLTLNADLVVKGTVLSDVPVKDASFEPTPGYEARETELAVVSVIKGSASGKVRFRHYAPAKGGWRYTPPNVAFTLKRTYVVFASNAGHGVYRQLTTNSSMKQDQDAILAGDDKPHRGTSITEIVWAELVTLLGSKAPDDEIAAIHELDERSGGRLSGLKDFARKPVADVLRPLLPATTGQVRTELLTVFGTFSPYMEERDVPYWLAGLGKGVISGLGARSVVKNTDAEVAVQELTAIADGAGPVEQRALAIRALGRSTPRHGAGLARWSKDPEPLIRNAAVLLAADVPDLKLITAAAADPSEIVRQGAAHAIGFSQNVTLLPTLGVLLRDPAAKVHMAAAVSLLSFSPDDSSAVLKANLSSDYRPLFINALARKDPSLYLAELADVIVKAPQPSDWWGGTIPSAESWRLLLDYIKKQPPADVQNKKFDASLDALESLKWFGSSEPNELYAFYLVRGLKARALRFRVAIRKRISFDMEYYFNRVDKDPAIYAR
jgi:hypothetical protein